MSQPQSNKDRLREGDEEYLSAWFLSVTYNEVHALQIGLIGFFVGLGYSWGMIEEALTVTALLVLIALGVRAIPGNVKGDEIPIAVKTKRHEPWWFISSYGTTFIIGVVVGGVI